jgi:hypothetical protein
MSQGDTESSSSGRAVRNQLEFSLTNTQPGGTAAALPSKLLNHLATWCQAVTVDDQSKRAL